MSLYSACKSGYHYCLPKGARDALYRILPRPLKRVRHRLIGLLEKRAAHDEIYDSDYYATVVDPTMVVSAAAMAASIVEAFAPKSVIDVGCGGGHLLDALRQRGVSGTGFERSNVALAICRAKGLQVHPLDLEHDTTPDARADVVVSTEVAEHLPPSCADRFVDVLTSIGEVVFLTAAVPSGEGTDHVNEQPNDYWIDKFDQRQYEFDRGLSGRWRREWREAGVAHCFANSAMVFRRRPDMQR